MAKAARQLIALLDTPLLRPPSRPGLRWVECQLASNNEPPDPALPAWRLSQVKKLVEYISYLPLSHLRLMPKKLPLLTVKSVAADAQSGGTEGSAYLIGFDIDKARMQGGELHMTNKVEGFRAELYDRAANQNLVTDETHGYLKIKFSTFGSWKELPDIVFEIGMGSRATAKAERKRILEKRKREAAEAEAAAIAAAPRDEGLEDDGAATLAGESKKRPLGEADSEIPGAKAQVIDAAGGSCEMTRRVIPVQEAPSLDWLHDG
eukprot:scaffold13786_cov31-Tisochrysis_lutea.AAC.3